MDDRIWDSKNGRKHAGRGGSRLERSFCITGRIECTNDVFRTQNALDIVEEDTIWQTLLYSEHNSQFYGNSLGICTDL